MAGMSGSPVYIDGRLVGAVAMAFPFAKDPIAGIRPIQDMMRPATAPVERAAIALADRDLTRVLPKPEPTLAGEARMVDIATPISFGGFSRATLEAFAPQTARAGPGAAPGHHRGRKGRAWHGQRRRSQARLHDQRRVDGRRP